MSDDQEDDGPAQASVHLDIQIRTVTGAVTLIAITLLLVLLTGWIITRISGRFGAPSH